MPDFLVYEHWRPDKGVCFYVGKGKKRRAYAFGPTAYRSDHHCRIVEKLHRLGLEVEVRFVATGLYESDAFAVERDRIAFWRSQHGHLINRTDGGDGTSGYRFTVEQREKIRQKAIGRSRSEATKAKMAAARRGQKRTAETREKMRMAALAVQSDVRKRVCATPAGKKKMLAMSRKAAADPEVRRKRAENAKALWADPVYRANMMAARAAAKTERNHHADGNGSGSRRAHRSRSADPE